METKTMLKRRNQGPNKVNVDINSPKLRKKEVALEKLSKQTVIEKFRELENEYSQLFEERQKKNNENQLLKDEIKELKLHLNQSKENSSSQTQTHWSQKTIQLNCDQFIHTANCEKALKWHMFHVHNKGNPEILMKFSCNNCHEKFFFKKELMKHIKMKHSESLSICKYF